MNTIEQFYYVYLLQNSDGAWYTGCTNDLWKRFLQHTSGQSIYTKHRGPYKLLYYEACLNSRDAYARERYLKSGAGKKYLCNRLKGHLEGNLNSMSNPYKELGMNPVTTQKTVKRSSAFESPLHFRQFDDSGKLSGL